jgi:DNA-directed RNA polymerase subunit K/omega
MSFLEEEYDRKYNGESDDSDTESEDSEMEMRKPKIKIHNDDVVLDEQDADMDADADADMDDDNDNDDLDDDNDDNDNEPDIFSDNREPKTTSSDLARVFQLDNDLSDNDLSDNDDDDDDDANYLQKFDENIQKEIIQEYHPELMLHNYQEVEALSKITRDENGIVIDPLHRTLPFITRYEYARVLGERAKQINAGAKPFVSVSDTGLIDGYLIALEEYKQKKIPFIIKRPLPNGGCEYWPLRDLENIV